MKPFLAIFASFLFWSSTLFCQNNQTAASPAPEQQESQESSVNPSNQTDSSSEAETTEAEVAAPAEEEIASLDSGNTAWMITATALVLFMTLPGLALFYGGLVQSKNVLSVLMHCFAIACLASIIWFAVGYSLALTSGSGKAWIGGTDAFFLQHLSIENLNGDHPETVWVMFQMTFAIITPGLIVGAFVERIKFSAVLIFSGLWLVLVYCPVCYWVWGGGWLAEKGVIDFAGGIVVHATAGASALTLAYMLGRRQGFPRSLKPPHNPGMVMTGAAMLWVGWFGFNAGSAGAADTSAGMAMLVTHISAATASLVWMLVEWRKTGKPGLVGIVTGTIAGLATITPASGSVGPLGAIIIGASAGFVCYYACSIVKEAMGIDDSLDVAAVHGVGGILGTLLVAFLGVEGTLGGLGINAATAGEQFVVQAQGCLAAIALSVVATYLIVKIMSPFIGGIRVSEDDETKGLDQSAHGENGYSLN
ncbi:MAG: ammonia channel protein [Opitutae bacterium]|nr:ammonia channel protein [Opitutae bacterium]